MQATRVLFLPQGEPDWWMLNSVYAACRNNQDFEVCVADIGFQGWNDLTFAAGPVLTKLAIPYVDGRTDSSILDELRPDIILLTSPYDEYRAPEYASARLAERARLVYFPYGLDFCGGDGFLERNAFGETTQRLAWRIISRSPATLNTYMRAAGKLPHQVAPLGLPVIDHYYDSDSLDGVPDHVIEASRGKFKILYTPHHTVGKWGTFLERGHHLRDLLLRDEDLYLLFRPHPGLEYALDSQGYMSTNDFRHFFPSDRSYLQTGDEFNGAFRWSDVLISDASSLIGQYAPTRKPIIYTENSKGPGLDSSSATDIRESCYVANDESQLLAHLELLRSGADPIREQRFIAQERLITGVFSPGTGARIASYLAEQRHTES